MRFFADQDDLKSFNVQYEQDANDPKSKLRPSSYLVYLCKNVPVQGVNLFAKRRSLQYSQPFNPEIGTCASK